jgi:O-antigen ligase
MKKLWLFFFPLLFMPNFGLTQQTSQGVLEISDWLMAPFVLLLLIAPSAKYKQRISQLDPYLWGFLVWALLSVLTIPFRYDYRDDLPILIGSALKLARLAVYVVAALLIPRALHDSAARAKWLWSMLLTLAMLSFGLLAGSRGDALVRPADALQGYKSYNLTVVAIAILCSYIAGLWIDNVGTRTWRRMAAAVVVFAGCSVVLSSSLSSHGRGGWLAFSSGIAYLLWKRIQTTRTLAILFIAGVISTVAYQTLPSFNSLVNATLFPSRNSNSEEPVDDGARVWTWQHEAPKFIDAPVLGTGFFHRGNLSGLWSSGSHNFFLQMFLETGIVGGVLVILVFACAWRLACHPAAIRNRVSVATRASLVTAITAGLSGEYFYGGTGALVLFAMLALVGSLPTEPLVYLSDSTNFRPLRFETAS